jgi:hypothetical protein
MAVKAAPASSPAKSLPLRVGRITVPLGIWLPLAIFAVTRLYDFFAIAMAARAQVALPSPAHPGIYQFTAHPDSPGYLALITNWDGQWYERIATVGYHLPSAGDPNGKDALNAFAFLPGFPLLVGAMMAATGLSFAVCVTIVNLLAGAGAMVVMFALVERSAGRFAAAVAVLLTSCFVAAPLFQAAYAESISLLLVCTILLLIARRRYGWAVVAVVVLSLTRLVTPPLAVVVLAHAAVRIKRRDVDPIRRAEVAGMAVLAVVSAGSVFLWSTITSVITDGVRATGADRGSVSAASAGRFGWFTNAYEHIGWIGVLGLMLLSGLLLAVALSPLTRTWGVELRTWFAIYPIFLLFVAGVHTGVFRYLLLAFPLALVIVGSPPPEAVPRKRASVAVVVSLVSLALVIPWVSHAMVVTPLAGKPWLP